MRSPSMREIAIPSCSPASHTHLGPAHALRGCGLLQVGFRGKAHRNLICHAQTMVRHKSRLEREKEAADAKKKASPEEAGSQGRQLKAHAQTIFPGEVNMQAIGVRLVEVHCS